MTTTEQMYFQQISAPEEVTLTSPGFDISKFVAAYIEKMETQLNKLYKASDEKDKQIAEMAEIIANGASAIEELSAKLGEMTEEVNVARDELDRFKDLVQEYQNNIQE